MGKLFCCSRVWPLLCNELANRISLVFVQVEDDISPVLAPKHKEALKEEPVENSNAMKSAAAASAAKGTPPTSKSAKGKRKINGEEAKATTGAPLKKVKSETVSNALLLLLFALEISVNCSLECVALVFKILFLLLL